MLDIFLFSYDSTFCLSSFLVFFFLGFVAAKHDLHCWDGKSKHIVSGTKKEIMQVQFKILIKLHERIVYSDNRICRSSFQRDF